MMSTDDELLCRWAAFLKRHRLEAPAMIGLELLRPLSFVGSQLLLLLEPFYAPWAGPTGRRAVRLLEDRRNITRLLALLERQDTRAPR
jgi:hypothetical protein